MDVLFRTTEEQPTPVDATLTGQVPDWLRGTYLRVGPGVFDTDDFCMNHWFDGFAVLDKFEISNGKVSYMKKFLQSDAYKKFVATKRPVFAEFGTRAYSDSSKSILSRVIASVIPDLTDNCAVNVFSCKGEYFVCSESAIIRKIDPRTLETLDKVDLRKSGATLMSSHFLTDSRGDMYNMATDVFTSAQYNLLRIPRNCSFKKCEIVCTLNPTHNKNPSSFHSFAASDNYIVFVEQPLTLNMKRVMSMTISRRSLYDCAEWQPHLMNLFHVIDKKSGKALPTKYMSTKPFFMCHTINCYEENNQLVLDLIQYDAPTVFDQMFLNVVRKDKFSIKDGGTAHRYVLPLIDPGQEPEEGKNLVSLKTSATAERKGNTIHVTSQQLSRGGYEQPCIHLGHSGHKYRYFYASGFLDKGSLGNTIVKVDTHTGEMLTWKESNATYPQGPYFVPRPGAQAEDDGLVLVALTNTAQPHSDALVLLDGATLTEVGRATVSCHVPNLMHGTFIIQQ